VVSRQATPEAAQGAVTEPTRPSRAEWIGVGAVFLLALALRLLHLQQLRAHDPFFELPSVDERMYHEWALAIRGGDWLGAHVFASNDVVVGHGPLYPYFLALLYGLFGPSVATAKAVQCVLGSFSCVLVWALARRLFDGRVALMASLATASYGMLLFYEGALVVTNLQVLLSLLILLAVVRALERPHVSGWLGAGLLAGLSAVARPNVLLFATAIAAWIPVALRHAVPRARRVALGGAFLAGVALMVLPVTLRNYALTGDWVLVSHAGGLNFFIGNNPDANGTFRVPRVFPRALADDPWEQRAVFESYAERASGRELAPSEVSAFWRDRGLDFVRGQPGTWLRLELRKLALSVNAHEPWSIRSFTLTREFSWVLRLPLVSFGFLGPLGLFGIFVTRRAWRRLVPLYAMLGTVLVTQLVFFVLSRYRMPAIPVLAIFGAAGLVQLLDAVHARRWRWVGLAAALLVALSLAVHRPILRENLSMAYYNLGNRYRELGRWDRAIDAYHESLRRDAGYISAHNNLAIAYERSGVHQAEAIQAWERVRALAGVRGLDRYVERAERHLRALRVPDTDDAPAPADP
jgi:4-amino-4-deoxy-L-arabinose transferase-like glycosyltransferase